MERCGFFDANLVGNEYDRVYLAEQFSAYFASFIGNGVFAGKSNELQVLSMETPAMQIRIQEGQGWINGYWYENMSELYLPIEVADGVLSRIDSVVLRLGMTERDMWIAVKKGTPSYQPVAPEVTRNDDYFELQLATVWIGAGYTNIKQSDITDTRLNAEVCGLVASVVQQFDTTTLGNQLQTFINEYMAEADVDYEAYIDRLDELKALAAQDKDNYFADLQALYTLCDNAYQEFLAYLAGLKSNGDDSLESLKSWIESLKLSSSAEINRLIEELRGLISDDIVSQLILRLTDLEREMPKKIPLPVDSELTEGVVYLNSDGTTKLIENREQLKRFKYSIIVDNGIDGNPAAVEYADDCINFIEAYGSNMGDWANTDLYKEYFRPCVIGKEDSEPKYFLQQDNMTLKEDGAPAVLDGTDGDVMIQVGKLYGKVTNLKNKFKLTILNYKEDESCFCFNEVDDEEKEYVYISSFEAFVPHFWENYGAEQKEFLISAMSHAGDLYSNDGYSSSFSQVLYSLEREDFISENKRDIFYSSGIVPQGYLCGWYFKTFQLYQWMSMFLYKTRNLQDDSALGKGLAAYNQEGINFTSGNANFGLSTDKPFCFGGDKTVPVKFLGVENFYGNTMDYIEGISLHYEQVGDGDDVVYLCFGRCSSRPSTYTFGLEDYDEQILLFSTNTEPSVSKKCFSKLIFFNESKFAFPFYSVDEEGENASTDTFWCDSICLTLSGENIENTKDSFIFVSTEPDNGSNVSFNGPFTFFQSDSIGIYAVEHAGTFRLFRYI